MPVEAQATPEDFVGFERGLDRESPRTSIPRGGYDAATNILLTGSTSGRVPSVVYADAVLDPLVVWPAGNPTWLSPFTYSVYDSTARTLVFQTHTLIARDTGQIHRYDPSGQVGVAGTVTNVRRGMTGEAQINQFVYDQWLGLVDGRDAPMKYGQHFLWNGQLEPTPFLFPFGSRPITPMVPSIAGENWTLTSGNKFQPDGSVPIGSRVGTHSLYLKRNTSAKVTFSATAGVDYTIGPKPYGGNAFADTDFIVISAVGASKVRSTGKLRVRFFDKNAAAAETTGFYEFTFNPNVANDAWTTLTALRSAAVKTGTVSWAQINRIKFFNDDRASDILVDDFYWLYANAPPAAAVATAHKTRVLLGGAPVGSTPGEPFLSSLGYSDAGHPDNHPSVNFQTISGGADSLAQASGITALREFGDQVIIGCPNAIFAWTIGDAGNPVKSTISTEHGIDSHRGVVETPQGSLIFPWQRGAYILRPTGRQFIASKIQPFLVNVALDDPTWTLGVVDEKTKTIRFTFREGVGATKATLGVVFDTVRSQDLGEPVWPSTFNQVFDFAVPAYVNGSRETLYIKSGDPQVYRMHVTRNGIGGTVELPWMARQHKDTLTKWVGLAVPYAADTPITVEARYANIPAGFAVATYGQPQTLPATTAMNAEGRVLATGSAKWVQFRFTSAGYFELYTPIVPLGYPTERPA